MAYLGNTPATADTNISLTTVQTAANQAAQLSLTAQEGDVVVRSDENKTYMHNGGSAGTMGDYTVLATPTDTVTSVNSATGAVTLTHDGFSDFVSNEHLDWTADQGSTNIHAGNYTDTNTTYTVGDGGLTTNDFTNADHTKLDGIEASADVTDVTNVTAAGALMDSELAGIAAVKATTGTFLTADQTKLDGIATSANNYVHPSSAGDKHIPTGGASANVLTYSSSGTAVWAAPAGGGVESGTKMMFYQASAPTDWTQDTTASLDGSALRVETGTGGGSGGTHDLASPPSTSHTHTGASHTHSTPSHSHSHSLSAGAHTLSTSELPSHTHGRWTGGNSCYGGSDTSIGGNSTNGGSYTTSGLQAIGGGSSHSHSLSGSITSGGSGTSGASGTGATSSSGGTAFAPKYVNVIICTKD